MILTEEELEIFQTMYERDGGEFVTVISPTTGFPYTTPVNFLYHDGKFYTSTNRKAAKIKFIRDGSTKGTLTYYINGSTRKPYIGVTGTFRLLGKDTADNIKQETDSFLSKLDEDYLKHSSNRQTIDQLRKWLALEDRLVIELTPQSVYGKTRGAL